MMQAGGSERALWLRKMAKDRAKSNLSQQDLGLLEFI